ncbi:TolC family protein [Gaoshiqia sediminis]|uniref:TolC family protein n=1 Tax=Gaoshiqia sediminis TaxID=2986998 RepID=A0AA41YB74_9BACT|nr:TolC family protein [Gaoshiqia sediminis]MCW0484483.1 TolC family protein [Gaoshiqia sediminis]
MKQTYIILLHVFMIAVAGSIHAQESWTLNQCIEYALNNNLDHRLYELDEQMAKVDATQSKLNLLPSLSISSSAGTSYGRSIDPNTNGVINTEFFNNSNSLNSSIGLFNGFTQQNRIAYSKFRLQASRYQRVNFQDDLAFGISMAYYDVVYFEGVVEIVREQLKLSEFNLKKTETQIATGLKAKTDLAEMQATYEREKLSLIQSENNLEEAKLNLGRQMNLPAGQLIRIVSDAGEPVDTQNLRLSSDSLFASFVQISPYVKMSEANLDAAGKNIAMVRGQYFPSVYLRASVNTGYSDTYRDQDGKTFSFSDQIDNNMSQYVGASVTIPIFGRNQVRSEVRKAKLYRDDALAEVEKSKQAVYYELINNTRELQALFAEYVQTKKQVEADELAYQVARRKYDEGLIDVIELLAVKSRLSEAQGHLLLTGLQWKIKDKVLEFYKGIRFWE